MINSFERAIGILWESIGQPPPDLKGETSIDFSVDDLILHLEEQGDGRRILINAAVGSLDPSSPRRDEQIKNILRDSLDLIATRRGCAYLAGSEASPVLMIGATHSYEDRHSDLRRLIDDVLFLWQWHSDRLRGTVDNSANFPLSHERTDVLFRP